MLKLIQLIFKWLGQEEIFEQQMVQIVANYAEDLYDKYGKQEVVDYLNPILANIELELVDTETYQRTITQN